MPRSTAEIDAEKREKSRPDLIPSSALLAAGRVMGYGFRKHGDRTWTRAGTEQADSRTHIASMMRHAIEAANDIDSIDEESGLENLACVITQACIAYDCRVAERVAEPLTVGSAFAAGQIEGETPRGDGLVPGSAEASRYRLPSGWEWRRHADRWQADKIGSTMMVTVDSPPEWYPDVRTIVLVRNEARR